LILVDSSVWIDFLSSRPGPGGRELRRLIEQGEPVAVTGVVVTEVLQGLTRDVKRIENYLRLFEMLEADGFDTYRDAANVFRLARSRGVSLTTTDALIASIAVQNAAALFSLDRDFVRMAPLASLQLHEFA
jgi:predicted nucleic acid-binding protein